jgi:hypothetical protein
MLKKIVSGGQTGADRAALDAALEADFPMGGYCPLGRKAEDGKIDLKYPLTETGKDYRIRTKKNVIESDGTVIFYSSSIQGGTEQTLLFCIKLKKPYKLIDISLAGKVPAVKSLLQFISDNNIETLNVAGPRLSNCPEIYPFVKTVISSVIKAF